MGWIAEGTYRGTDPALGAEAELRVDRGGDNRNVVLVSGDVYLADGVVRSFVGEQSSLTTSAAGGLGGVARLFSTGAFDRKRSRLAIEPADDDPDGQDVVLSVTFDPGELKLRLSLAGPLARPIVLKIDRLSRAPAPPDAIFDDAGAGRTLRSSLAEAGIEAEIGELGVIDESTDVPKRTAAELHKMMQQHAHPPDGLSRQWWLHLMLARQFDWPNAGDVAGVMYDVDGRDGTPPRQGVAVFLESPTLTRLKEKDPEDWRREILFTLVHEIGHGLNLPHAFENDRAKELTWMNYPEKFEGGAQAFWRTFENAFGVKELRYLRHAPCCDIAPGRSAYATRLSDLMAGGDANSVARLWGAMVCDDGVTPRASLSVEPLKTIYAFGEPIFLKVSVANEGETSIKVPRALDPTDGHLRVAVTGPNGRRREFRPPLALCQKVISKTVRPGGKAVTYDGAFVSFDAVGPLFDQPGPYSIEASFNGLPGATLVAKTSELRVLYPTREEELLALRLWGDRELMRAVYYRQPLIARKSWRQLLDAHRRALKTRPDDPTLSRMSEDTTLAYLEYVGAMGYAERYRPAGVAESGDRNGARCARKLTAVKVEGLPGGVATRVRAAKRAAGRASRAKG